MKLKLSSWVLVVLCTLLASNNVNADVAAETIQDKLVDMPVDVALSGDTNNENAPDRVEDAMPAKDEDIGSENTQEKETAKENKEALALEALINAEVVKEPGMQRLARQLNRFHNHQLVRSNANNVNRNNNAVMRRASDDFPDQDEEDDALAEERAVRRRKRIRRRNTKNKIKRTHRNKHVANRRKSSRRKSSNKNSVRRKNVKKAKTKRSHKKKNKNTRLGNEGGGGNRRDVKRRGSSDSGSKRKTNRNKGSKNQKRKSSSKRKSNKRKKSNKDSTSVSRQQDQIPDNFDVAQDFVAVSDF